jgi:hypothetical protein
MKMQTLVDQVEPTGRYARLEIVSRHLSTTVPPSYAVTKKLKIPGPDTLDDMKAKRILLFRTVFLDHLAPNQRLYNASFEMFRWPSTVYLDSNDVRVFLDNARSGLDFVITSHTVPKKILFHVEYEFKFFMKRRLPKISYIDTSGNRTEIDLDPDWDEDNCSDGYNSDDYESVYGEEALLATQKRTL